MTGQFAIGTGPKLDLNFSFGFEWAPFTLDLKDVRLKKNKVEVKDKTATIENDMAQLKKVTALLNKSTASITKTVAEINKVDGIKMDGV